MTDTLQPRNKEEIDRLEREAAAHLAGMARGSLMAGQMPPKAVLEWYADYCAEAVIATESMVMQSQTDGKLTKDEAEVLAVQLEQSVIATSEILAQCAKHKLFVLQERIVGKLRARALHLPLNFDTSYDGMLPRV